MVASSGLEPWRELYLYWQSKHIDGRPPSRRDIDPLTDIPRIVPNILIADILPEGYRYRLVGSHIVERFRTDMTGRMAGTSDFLGSARREGLSNYDAVRDEIKPRIVVAGLTPTMQARNISVILPLVDHAGHAEMILAGVFFDGRFDPDQRALTLSIIELAAAS